MNNFKLDNNVLEDMKGNSKRVIVKYLDNQDVNDPIAYSHYRAL